ncbi:uncharacterized protein G2W53_001619 [Senna tora]|uniref:BED-type domain-containing protein n=1 Tax=Senna tora TaxID=362788 RepID=A0A834XI19_9FABA|nr:uncharacterized protein G2W53_001619 [Senna tora]
MLFFTFSSSIFTLLGFCGLPSEREEEVGACFIKTQERHYKDEDQSYRFGFVSLHLFMSIIMEPPPQPPSAENIDGNRNNIGTASASGSGVVGHNRKRKNALGSRSDIGWKHGYTVEGDSRKVICKYCGNTYTGGIYRFKHHLAGTRDNVEPCISVPDNVRKEMLTVLVKNMTPTKENYSVAELGDTESRPTVSENLIRYAFKKQVVVAGAGGSRSIQSTINHLLKKDLREEASRQIARFFYTSAIPFNCVKNPDFEKMCELIAKHGSGFKPPTFYEVREKFLKQEVEETNKLIKEHRLEWKKKGCTIMSDGWTDKKKRSIVNFLVNSPRGTVFLSSKDVFDVSKTAEKVFEMLDEIVEQVGEENVVQVVTDNAAN